MRSSIAALSLIALLTVACGGPEASPTGVPTLAPTAPPTVAPTPTPSETPFIEIIPTLEPARLLTAWAHPDLRDTCRVRDQVYDAELAAITCGPEDLPFDYSLFESANEMDAAFDDDVAGAETPPEPDGTCADGNYLSEYDLDGRVGRVNCRQHTSSSSGALYHVIEWTSAELLVIGYISNRADLRSWQDLIDFWAQKAGPFTP